MYHTKCMMSVSWLVIEAKSDIRAHIWALPLMKEFPLTSWDRRSTVLLCCPLGTWTSQINHMINHSWNTLSVCGEDCLCVCVCVCYLFQQIVDVVVVNLTEWNPDRETHVWGDVQTETVGFRDAADAAVSADRRAWTHTHTHTHTRWVLCVSLDFPNVLSSDWISLTVKRSRSSRHQTFVALQRQTWDILVHTSPSHCTQVVWLYFVCVYVCVCVWERDLFEQPH